MTIPQTIQAELNKSYSEKRLWSGALKRYNALSLKHKQLADEGIYRYFNACVNTKIMIEVAPVREIIEDAKTNRQIWKESNAAFIKNLTEEKESVFQSRLRIKNTGSGSDTKNRNR